MQVRSLVAASLVHGALIVGVGLGVHPWIVESSPLVEVSVLPQQPQVEVPDESILREDLPPPPDAEEPEFVEPQYVEPVQPTAPDEDAEVEEEVVEDEPEPLYYAPQRLPPSPDLLLSTRPPAEFVSEAEPVVESAAESDPAEASDYVEAESLDEQNEPPVYPGLARRLSIEGDVILLVTVEPNGEVSNVELLESAGLTRAHKALDRAAIAAICRWRYKPAVRGGRNVAALIKVPVQFRIE